MGLLSLKEVARIFVFWKCISSFSWQCIEQTKNCSHQHFDQNVFLIGPTLWCHELISRVRKRLRDYFANCVSQRYKGDINFSGICYC